jgi:predicted RNA-binding Zn-ribbon protein involved in translation (DUF1610 family)
VGPEAIKVRKRDRDHSSEGKEAFSTMEVFLSLSRYLSVCPGCGSVYVLSSLHCPELRRLNLLYSSRNAGFLAVNRPYLLGALAHAGGPGT